MVPLGYTYGCVLYSGEGIKLGSTDGEILCYTLEVDGGYTLGVNEGTEMGFLKWF